MTHPRTAPVLWTCGVVLAVTCSTSVTAARFAQLRPMPAATVAVLPSNLAAASVFQPFLDSMYGSSPTFRRQCRRLGAAPHVKVALRLEELRRRPSFDARTVFRRQNGAIVSADVFLSPSRNAVEFIAHEVEHVLEQLDGVDLEAQLGSGHVWRRDDGAFETRRAAEAGRRVAREVGLQSTGTLVTVLQQDRLAGPADARSARVSALGRHVVFSSYARLVPEDVNRSRDVYVLDLSTRQPTLESLGIDGTVANGESVSPDISGDGRFIVFVSSAGNLTHPQIPAGVPRVFLRDRELGVTRLLARNANGEVPNAYSQNPAISADGTTAVFESAAADLVNGADSVRNVIGVYMTRRSSPGLVRLNVPSTGEARSGQSVAPAISADGRYVAFTSRADLTCSGQPACLREPPDRNGVADIYVRDTVAHTTTRVSRGHAGREPDGPSYDAAISGDGRYVAFVSEASNLLPDKSRRVPHIYVHDRVTGETELVSRTPAGRLANGSSARPAISQDGSTIAFQSLASDLLCQGRCLAAQRDTNLVWDVFVHERRTGRTTRASADDGVNEWTEESRAPSLDGTGRVIAFVSRHALNDSDDAHDEDLFVWVAPP
jgi:Tol biopolymer transport system component